ncbi:MAG: hypothetical protein GX417_02675 [Clostridiales bacterium]|nr:hypothetical protein [Clostridiales bacterium]
MKRKNRAESLQALFPPSTPCSCAVCRAYCLRPGWWTVEEATQAFLAGYGGRMMLELSPDRTYGVLSPAFRGCEGTFAFQEFSENGCTFYAGGRCALYGTGFEPLECRFCHHERRGLGQKCHAALARDWRTPAGQALVREWMQLRQGRFPARPPAMGGCGPNRAALQTHHL